MHRPRRRPESVQAPPPAWSCRCPTGRRRRRGGAGPAADSPAPPAGSRAPSPCPPGRRAILLLCRPVGRHHGADAGPAAPGTAAAPAGPRRVEVVAVAPQIAVEHDVGGGSLPMPVEIHQQEGQIVERVDGGDGLVELDGVEQDGPAAPQHDVAEVQVAVAAAHAARPRRARRELPRRAVELQLRRACEAIDVGSIERLQARHRSRQRRRTAGRSAPAPSRRAGDGGTAMALQHRVGDARAPTRARCPLPKRCCQAAPTDRSGACAPPTRPPRRCRPMPRRPSGSRVMATQPR